MRTRNSKHITKRTKYYFRRRSYFNCFIDFLNRRNADRATRTVNKGNVFWKQFIYAVFNNRMSLSSANFHYAPIPFYYFMNSIEVIFCFRGISVFIDVFQFGLSSVESRPNISSRYSRVFFASSSSITDNANPT